jgi:cell wall-associated NlpC family hydrolase
MASFTDQLVAALEGYLGQSGNGSNLEIDIQTTQSQNSGERQFIVTVKNPDSTPAQAGTASPVVPAASASAAAPASAAPASSPSSAPLDDATRTAQTHAEIDAYWAGQPPAVQQLRNVSDFGERSALAQQLSEQGYSVDRAIMVWGWDPMKTMLTRKMYGYSWVPSYNQASVSTPDMAVSGQTPYDAGNPPPGSIAVNTNFANGLGISNPWA